MRVTHDPATHPPKPVRKKKKKKTKAPPGGGAKAKAAPAPKGGKKKKARVATSYAHMPRSNVGPAAATAGSWRSPYMGFEHSSKAGVCAALRSSGACERARMPPSMRAR